MNTLSFLQQKIFGNKKLLAFLFIIIALFGSVKYTFFRPANNYTIFYYSLQHLVEGKSLYAAYPEVYFDYYLYAPTFPMIFAPVFVLPEKVGLFLWTFIFTGIWVLAVYKMPWNEKQKLFVYWYVLQELLLAIDNVQTNPLISAVPLFAFICMERGKIFWAAFFIILGFNVKIYSIVTAALFILYPGKIKFIGSMLFWFIVFTLLPLLVTTPGKLIWQYELWFDRSDCKVRPRPGN